MKIFIHRLGRTWFACKRRSDGVCVGLVVRGASHGEVIEKLEALKHAEPCS